MTRVGATYKNSSKEVLIRTNVDVTYKILHVKDSVPYTGSFTTIHLHSHEMFLHLDQCEDDCTYSQSERSDKTL